MRFAFLLFLGATVAQAQSTHYTVKLTPDFDHHVLSGEETIEFVGDAGKTEWQKQPGLAISGRRSDDGAITVSEQSVKAQLYRSGKHTLELQYTAAAYRGIAWFSDQTGFDTAFYCEAWMVCNTDPAQRAILTLEIVVPAASGLTAVGPGQFKKQWRDAQGEHFAFEQSAPVQTYLFSFGVAKLHRLENGKLVLYASNSDAHRVAFSKTAEAYLFLRGKAGMDLDESQYTQASMPNGIEQEAAALALMPKDFLHELEENGDVGLMTHELAHQWWGVTVGIRSWSDFWLNEGMADFMEDAYLERLKGRAAYDQQITAAKEQLERLRAERKDRPLHWEGWKDAQGALGRIPYAKGALFLARLRTELGEQNFWDGIALYTKRNAGRLVDSRDFERAMEETSGRDLKGLFDEAVYH
jgi:aminopeptidase N